MKSAPQVAGLLVLAASIGLCDQKNAKPPKNPPRAAAGPAAKNPGRAGEAKAAAAAPHINNPLNPASRFLNMTPEEQERVIEKATPEQRERLLQARARWQSMAPAQREFVYRQYQSLSKLPPGEQALVTRQMNAFNKLPDERRKPVRAELIRLLRMPPEQRPARLANEEFAHKYSPEERQILKDLSTTLPEDYPLAGR
jgi:hypothetical protein